MPTRKRPHVALIMMFGIFLAAVAMAGPAGASPYVPPSQTEVLGEVVTSDVPGSGTVTSDVPGSGTGSNGVLASTGRNVIGVVALGGLLLVGGGVMVFAGKRRKVDA